MSSINLMNIFMRHFEWSILAKFSDINGEDSYKSNIALVAVNITKLNQWQVLFQLLY